MLLYDVFVAAVDEDEVVIGLFDPRYGTVMVIKPILDREGNPKFEITDPDGADWLYWQEKFGIIGDVDFQAQATALEPQSERKKLLDRLEKEFGRPVASAPDPSAQGGN